MEENINCLGNEVLVHKSAYLSPLGWPGIYSGDFPSWMVIRTLSYGMGDFLSLLQSY